MMSIAPTPAQPLSYRSRRSALIPNDVSLSPEEEALVADRIGYRPLPPPGATESTWFATVTEPNWSPRLPKSQYEDNCDHVAAAELYTESDVLSNDHGNAEEEAIHPPKATKTYNYNYNARRPGTPSNNLDHDKSDATTSTTMAASRYRQLSWKIDIPHMSEVQPLNNRTHPPNTSLTTQYPRPWTAVVRTAMPPPNIDNDKFSMGNLSPHGSSSRIEA